MAFLLPEPYVMPGCDPLDPPTVSCLEGLSIERKVVAVDGHTVAAEMHLLERGKAGDRPTVVFLHGVLTSSCLAAELFEDPSAVSWISLSLPGHFGGSLAAGTRREDVDKRLYVRLTEGALQELVGSQQVILVGWSLGGFTALAVTAAHPERVLAVASLAGFAEPRFTGVVRVLSWLVQLPVVARVVRFGIWVAACRPRFFWLMALLTAHNWRACFTPAGKATFNSIWSRYRCHDAESLTSILATLHRLNLGTAVSSIRCPAWIGSGSRDPVVPVAEARRIAGRLPQAELQVYDGAGHMFFCEWPGFRKHLAAWLAGISRQ